MDDYSYVQQAVFTLEAHAHKVLSKMSREDLWLLALLGNPLLIEGWQVGKKEDLIEDVIDSLGRRFNIFNVGKVMQQDRLCSDILDAADELRAQ